MSKVNVVVVSHMTRVGSLRDRIILPEEWKELMPTATTHQFLEWCDRESVNAGKACVVAMTLLDLLLRKLMERGTPDQIKGFDVQKTISAGLSYCRLDKIGPSASYLQDVHLEIADVMPVGCAPIDDQTAAYLRNHITRNVMLLYSRDAIWKHVEKCLRAVFVTSKLRDREVVLRHVQCNTPLGEDISVDMMKWLNAADVVDQLKELQKYERRDAEEEDEGEEEGSVPTVKKKRSAKRRDDEKDELLKGLDMVNHLVLLSSGVRFKLLNAMTREILVSAVSSTSSDELHPVLKRWKRFSFVPIMKASRTFVTVDKMTVRSFLKACAKANLLEVTRASKKRSHERDLDAEDKILRKQQETQRRKEENARRAERAEWVEARRAEGAERAKGNKRARRDIKNKKQLEAEFDKLHPAIQLAGRQVARGGGKWVAPDFFTEICVTKDIKRSQWNAFLASVDLCNILRVRKRERRGGAQCMATFKTNGIEAHVPFEIHRMKEIEWDETKGSPPTKLKHKGHSGDFPSKDGTTFSLLQHGVWKAEALSKEHFNAAKITMLHFVDPGVKNIFTCSSCDAAKWRETQGRFMHPSGMESKGWTRGEYHHRRGTNLHRFRGERSEKKKKGGKEMKDGAKIQRGWVPPAVRDIIASLPSMKVFTFADACDMARKRLQLMLLGEYWRFMSCRKVARNRFHRFQRGQSALDNMVNTIAPPSSSSVVIFGNFSGRRALRGEAGVAPVKKLRRHLAVTRRLLVLDEYRTSKMCSFCDNELTHPKEKRMIPDRKVEKLLELEKKTKESVDEAKFRKEKKSVVRELNGVCICSEHKRLARDPNASHNMSQCFWSLLHTGQRPLRLQRPSQPRLRS